MTEPETAEPHIPGWSDLVAAGVVAEPRPEVVAAARMAVRDAIRHDIAATAGTSAAPAVVPLAPAKRRRRMTLWAAPVGLAAALAAVAIAVPVVGAHRPTVRTTSAGTSASAFLVDVASAQSTRTDTWSNAPYWRILDTRVAADGTSVHFTELLAHHAGLTTHQEVTSPTKEDKQSKGPWRFHIGTRALNWEQLSGLPTSPKVLGALLRTYANPGEDTDEGIFDTIGDLLVSPTPPKVRAALYQVAAGLPGVRLMGKTTDGSGRPGTAVERGDGSVVIRYVLDPTGGLLETVVSTVHALPAIPPGLSSDQSDGGVDEGTAANGSRPAMAAGAVVERTTYTSVGPAASAG